MSQTKRFTNENGAPVADNTNIMTAGPRGPALLQDIWLLEKLAHFDREVIPETPHARKGLGRLRHLHRYARHYPLYQGEDLQRDRQADADVRALLHRRR
jgi:catalase